jgi:hypothetical protein
MNDDETQAPPEAPAAAEKPETTDAVLVAEMRLRPDGRLVLNYSQHIDDMVAFLAAGIDLLCGLLMREHAEERKRAQLSKILRVPPGTRVKQ